jgi:hypothetical protein
MPISIKVVFEKQTILKEDAVKGLPEYIRECFKIGPE